MVSETALIHCVSQWFWKPLLASFSRTVGWKSATYMEFSQPKSSYSDEISSYLNMLSTVSPSAVGIICVGMICYRSISWGGYLTTCVTSGAQRPRSEEHTSELQSQSNI